MSTTSPALPPARVVPATPADCPGLAEVYRLSFLPNALGQAMFGQADPNLVAAKLGERFRKLLDSPKHAIFKAVRAAAPGPPTGAGEGEADEVVLGFAWWELPKAEGKEEEAEEEVKREWSPGTNVELVKGLFADLEEQAKKIERRHYHLHMLGTDPQYQRTGAGSALVRWGMAKADEEGVALYLDATDEGVPLYERLGFTRWDEPVWLRDQSCALYPMCYKPTTK